MTKFRVKVKWGGQTFDDVEVDTTKDAEFFKETLYALTGVPVDRQKVMAKGLWKGTLKDDTEMAGLPWKDGALVGLMGSSTGIPKPPAQSAVFVEDMTDAQKQKVAAVDPPGLVNLGNTCYMNSTLQCLRAIPELQSALRAAPLDARSGDIGERMTASLRDLFAEMDGVAGEVTPRMFVAAMRMTFPQFAQQTQRGGFAQQDVDEFYNELLQVLSTKLTRAGDGFSLADKHDAIAALFGIEMATEMRCVESDDEDVVRDTDTLRRLQCNINADVGTLEEGLRLGMESELEKASQALGRNALWKVTSRVHRLPKYLTVQFNRFFWKRTPESRDHEGVNCKILKPVKFNMTLDVFDFCDDDLQAILGPARKAYAKERMGRGRASKPAEAEAERDGDAEMAEANDDPELAEALRLSMGDAGGAGAAGVGIPADFRGVYELFAVITHKGRASDSGHYMSWVKQGPNDWIVFDDEMPSRCKDDDVARLYGGGDYDTNYMCLYRVPKFEQE